MSEFQEWCKEILPVVQAGAKGEAVEYLSEEDGWKKKQLCWFNSETWYRIKPTTIKIGDIEVPEPLRNAPAIGCFVYCVSTGASNLFCGFSWNGSEHYQLKYLNRGLLHLTEENAIKHAKALLALTEVV